MKNIVNNLLSSDDMLFMHIIDFNLLEKEEPVPVLSEEEQTAYYDSLTDVLKNPSTAEFIFCDLNTIENEELEGSIGIM